MEARKQLEALGQPEFIHGPHLGADDAKDDLDPKSLPNDTGAKSSGLRGIGKIDVSPLGELRPLRFAEETSRKRGSVGRGQLWQIGPDRLENTMESPDRLCVDPKMNVGGAAFLSEREISVDVRNEGRIDGGRCWGHGEASLKE